jgi:hypothetical protein
MKTGDGRNSGYRTRPGISMRSAFRTPKVPSKFQPGIDQKNQVYLLAISSLYSATHNYPKKRGDEDLLSPPRDCLLIG